MSWHRIANLDQVARGQRLQVDVAGRELMLLHTADGMFCVDYRCPHTGGPLGDGLIAGTTLTCPLHKWRFDLCDGTHNHGTEVPPAGVYQLKLEGQELFVEL